MKAEPTGRPALASLPVETLDEESFSAALAQVRSRFEPEQISTLDAVIHGVRVRLHTDSAHWRGFWSTHWFTPDTSPSWQRPPHEPQVQVYAARATTQTSPQAYCHREGKAALLTGDVPYGPLRALTLRAVARRLAKEQAAQLLSGLCLEKEGRGTLLLFSPDLDRAAALPPLLEQERGRLVAWGGVAIQYGLVRMSDEATLLPLEVVAEKGDLFSGYRLFPWLYDYGYAEPRADARCRTLEGEEVYCFARDLDLGRDPDALAFPVERAWYVPTQLVAAQPGWIAALWSGPWENVPPLTTERLDRFGPWARQAVAALTADDTPTRALVERVGENKVVEALCRLRAAPRGRALATPADLPDRAGRGAGEPVRLERVARMERHGPVPLDPPTLAAHLSAGAPEGTQESRHIFADLLARATRLYPP